MKSLKTSFSTSYRVLQRNTDGVTHEESLFQPQPAGNCMNWVLGHVVESRNDILRLLKAEPIWTAEEAGPYVRGAEPMRDAARARPFATLLDDLDRSQERLMARLDTLTSADLAAPSGMGDNSVEQMLGFLQFHESYHTGQIGLLRRLAGKEGAIR